MNATSGVTIALLGPDGSGKSTIAEALTHGVGRRMFRGVDCHHANFHVLPLLKSFKRPFGSRERRVVENRSPTRPANAGMTQPRNPWVSLIYVLYYSLDYALGSRKLKQAVAAGRLTILDRCIYDYFLQRQHRRVPHWLLRVLVRLLPKPDLVVFLEGTPEIIHRRKPELTAEEIQHQIDVMIGLSSWMPNAVRLRTDRPPADAVSELESHIGSFCRHRRGGTRL
jgi:thymidylate kinase